MSTHVLITDTPKLWHPDCELEFYPLILYLGTVSSGSLDEKDCPRCCLWEEIPRLLGYFLSDVL